MASTLTEEARRSILEKGFWKREDTDVGKCVDRILRGGFHFKTPEGLNLCKVAVLDDLVGKPMAPVSLYLTYSSVFVLLSSPSSRGRCGDIINSTAKQRTTTAF